MSKPNQTKKNTLRGVFERALRQGLDEAAKTILKTSKQCAKEMKGSGVEKLANNVLNTLEIFVTEKKDASFVRYQTIAEPLIVRLVEERSKTLSLVDSAPKITKQGRAFGFMSGMSSLTSVIKIFTTQAASKLSENQEMTEDNKRVCLSFINDVFGVILMSLSTTLDNEHIITKRDRAFFADILSSNEWNQDLHMTDGPTSAKQPNQEASAES